MLRSRERALRDRPHSGMRACPQLFARKRPIAAALAKLSNHGMPRQKAAD